MMQPRPGEARTHTRTHARTRTRERERKEQRATEGQKVECSVPTDLATNVSGAPAPTTTTAGLVFKTRTLPPKGSSEVSRKVFVNVVMHELVKRPLNASMEEV